MWPFERETQDRCYHVPHTSEDTRTETEQCNPTDDSTRDHMFHHIALL
jgi:hypothetical protein